MKPVFQPRAAAILFYIIRSAPRTGKYLLPANSCTVLPLTLLKAGADFEVCDISPDTLCIDGDQVLTKLKSSPNSFCGIVYVHTYGEGRTPNALFEEIKLINDEIIIIDDRCLCPPDFNFVPSQFADATLFSTNYAKFVDIGGGGFAFIANGFPYEPTPLPFSPTASEEMEMSVKAAMKRREPFIYRDADWLQTDAGHWDEAEYQRRVLDELTRVTPHKNKLTEIYTKSIPPEIQLQASFQQWRFNIRVPDKETLLTNLLNEGLFASSHYQSLGGVFTRNSFPIAERLHRNIVNLFNDRYYDEGQAWRTAEIVNEHLRGQGH